MMSGSEQSSLSYTYDTYEYRGFVSKLHRISRHFIEESWSLDGETSSSWKDRLAVWRLDFNYSR
jgi:hypothetical protein